MPSGIITKKLIRNNKPDYPVNIDHSNPITNGLVNAVVHPSARDEITNQQYSVFGSPYIKVEKSGKGIFFNGTDDEYRGTINHNIGIGEFTWTVHIKTPDIFNTNNYVAGIGTYEPAFHTHHGSAGNEWGLYIGGVAAGRSGDVLSTNTEYILTVRRSSATGIIEFFKDGVLLVTSSTNVTNITSSDFVIGAATAGSFFGTGILYSNFIHERALTDAEILQLHKNPYQILQPITQYWPVSSVGVTTINADRSITTSYIGSFNLDRTTNNSYIHQIAPIDHTSYIENITTLDVDKLIPTELTQTVTIDNLHTVDYFETISKLTSIFVDYTILFTDIIGEPTITIDPSANVITVNIIAVIDYSGTIEVDPVSNIEYFNYLSTSKLTSIEHNIEVNKSSTYSIDYLNSSGVGGSINVSHLGSLYTNNTINVENTGELIVGSTNTIAIEYFNFLNNDNIINISHSSLLDKNTDTSIEYIHSVSQDSTTLEEYVSSLYTDVITSIESKQALSIDNIHPINHFAIISKLANLLVGYKVVFTDVVGEPTITIDPDTNTITVNMVTAIDHNASIEKDSDSNIEFKGSFDIDRIIPVGHGNEIDIDITRIFNVEHVGTPSFDRVMNSEYGNTLSADHDLPTSFNYLRTKDYILSVSNEQQTHKDNDINIGISSIIINDESIVLESKLTIQKTSLTNIEYILELSNTNILKVGYIHSINSDQLIEIEHLGLYIVIFDQIIPVEYKYNLSKLNTLSISHLNRVARYDMISVGYYGSLILSHRIPTSYNTGIENNRSISIDYNASITDSITTPIENRYILDFNRVTPVDYFHSIEINKSITSGFSHVLNNDALLNVNWIQFIEQHSIIPMSFLHALEQSTVTNIEHQKSIALDQNVNIEFYNNLNINKTVNVEELSVIFSDEYDLPVDWREQIISDDIAVIEYDSYVILVPITDAANIWNLETRKTSWEINNTITLDDNDVWNLEARKYTWIIQKK